MERPARPGYARPAPRSRSGSAAPRSRPGSAAPLRSRPLSAASSRSAPRRSRPELDWFRQIVKGEGAQQERPRSAAADAPTASSSVGDGQPQSAAAIQPRHQRPSSAPAGRAWRQRCWPSPRERVGTGRRSQSKATHRERSEWRSIAITDPDAFDQHRRLRDMCLRGNHLHPNLQPWFCPAMQLSAAPATAVEGLDGAPWKRLPGNLSADMTACARPAGTSSRRCHGTRLCVKRSPTRLTPAGSSSSSRVVPTGLTSGTRRLAVVTSRARSAASCTTTSSRRPSRRSAVAALQDNRFGEAGAVVIAKALESGQCQLTSLNLARESRCLRA
jgi:hypothetical protein